MSRIEQLISDIESYIDNCKYYPLSNVKIIVNKEQLEDMLTELRLKTPDEVKKYQKILSNKEAILADAKEQAEAIINAAQIQTEELINEHEIMQRAYAQANQLIEQATAQAQAILDNATEDANNIRMSAMNYTDDMLENLQMNIEYKAKRDSFRLKDPDTKRMVPQSFEQFKARCIAEGARDGQFKLQLLMQDDTRHNKFLDLVVK